MRSRQRHLVPSGRMAEVYTERFTAGPIDPSKADGPIPMKIASYRTRPACPSKEADPVREPIAAALANFVTIEVRADSGLQGIGYSGFVHARMLGPLMATMDALAEQALGADPLAVEAVSRKLLNFGGNGAPAGLVTLAAAAIDTALWDLKGKAFGQPLFRLLGGTSNRVRTYASGYLWRNYDADMLAEAGAGLVERGFQAMKFRMGAHARDREEVRRMRALREAVGEDIDLMVDINQDWDVPRAIRMGAEIDACGLYWLEDPVHHQDYAGMRQISTSIRAPIATGEYHFGIQPIGHMLAQRAVDIVMVDLLRVGGITHWMKAAGMAEGFNKPIVSHLAPEILGHCLAAAPNGLIAEHMPWALPLFANELSLAGGAIVLPERPGLGLEFDEEALERLHPDA